MLQRPIWCGLAVYNLLRTNLHHGPNFDEGVDFIDLFVSYSDATISPVHQPMQGADPSEVCTQSRGFPRRHLVRLRVYWRSRDRPDSGTKYVKPYGTCYSVVFDRWSKFLLEFCGRPDGPLGKWLSAERQFVRLEHFGSRRERHGPFAFYHENLINVLGRCRGRPGLEDYQRYKEHYASEKDTQEHMLTKWKRDSSLGSE